jgi:quinol monooxygenase YgiN
MIVTVAKVTDFEKFLDTFSTQGVDKRRRHGCKGAEVFRDPDDPNRVWAVFDWSLEDYQQFLADPEIPAIARQLALQEPPIELEAAARYDA